MKKIITFFVLFTFFKGYTQCPEPSNLAYSIVNAQDALLSWTENGTATQWDVAVVPYFNVGTPLPNNSYDVASSNSFAFANFPPTGCNVFFVRSSCSATDVSSWVALPTSDCNTTVTNYLTSLLSTDDFSFNNKVNVYPNPSSDVLFIDNFEKQIKKIEFFDLQGRIIKTILGNNEKYQIDISNLLSATYLIKLSTATESESIRFVKK